jgi:hypothetical protein
MATHETIITEPSGWGELRVAETNWLLTLAEGIERVLGDDTVRTIRIDMNGARFIALFEWTSACALLQRLLEKNTQLTEINIDFTSNGLVQLVPARTIIDARATMAELPPLIAQSERIYRAIGFLESLGTLELLNPPTRSSRVFYGYVDMANAQSYSSFYGGRDADTVINGLHRIATPDDCLQFLDNNSIIEWRRSMASRFAASPLFASDEVWRVFSHELAVNIWEHATARGVVAARVLEPRDGRPRGWWSATFSPVAVQAMKAAECPVLELCATDAGAGLIATLTKAYRDTTHEDTNPKDVIAFAFDDIGTSKDTSISWTTERHALGRVLRLVQKYGGVLLLRTGSLDAIYAHKDEGQQIHHTGYGFSPARVDEHVELRGTHIQLAIPLYPLSSRGRSPRPRLKAALPMNFTIEPQHGIGHLVPLREYFLRYDRPLSDEDQAGFRLNCEQLNQTLLTGFRPSTDPIVIDFTGLQWTPSEFETLLHYLEPVLQRRPSLLVELDRQLALEVEELESGGVPSRLTREAAPRAPALSGRLYGRLSERQFLETYNRVHSCVLGIDRDGKVHVFGVAAGEGYRKALLELIHTHQSLAQLQKTHHDLDSGLLAAVLNTANPAFEVSRDGRWSTSWGEREISVAAGRALIAHFDHVADICGAWAGRRMSASAQPPLFQIPWEHEWLYDFFEASRILTRERYADEIAQRLLARLAHALAGQQREVSDVGVLVSLTSPGLQLAHALHRWWPTMPRPSVVDLGYYIGLAEHAEVPVIPTTRVIVVVQDVLDTLRRTLRVAERLAKQSHTVAATLAVVRLVGQSDPVGPTQIENAAEETPLGPAVTLMHLRRPSAVASITGEEEWADHAYWIEPRTLQPFRFGRLRYENAPPQPHQAQRENSNAIDDGPEPCAIIAGHYAYGHRHFDATIDVYSLLKSTHGTQIATWIADVCEDRQRDAAWEEEGRRNLHGDVTAVLMPLHSQIHYLWPQVQMRLARRGRRQPFFMLDTTLFLRDEGAFHVPRQLTMLIRDAVRSSVDAHHRSETGTGLRLLILDDAIASARTMETIIAAIDSALALAYRQEGATVAQMQQSVFEWIRYFAVLNKMSAHKDHFWNSLRTIGAPPTRFHFDHYARFSGMAVFTKEGCHFCRTRGMAENVSDTSAAYPGAEDVGDWARQYAAALEPIAIDTEAALRHKSLRLPIPIRAITSRQENSKLSLWPPSWHADTAIWRFHELMEMAVPPSLLLRSLPATPDTKAELQAEYVRYRAAVLSWCIRHWERTVAHAATRIVCERIAAELLDGEMDVLPLILRLATLARESEVSMFVQNLIDQMVETDVAVSRARAGKGIAPPAALALLLRLEKAVTVLMLARPHAELEMEQRRNEEAAILPYLERRVTENREALFSRNLLLRLLRPARAADPRWALLIVAETLYRGRDPEYNRVGSHLLLPRLLDDLGKKPADAPTRRLAQTSATLFRAALRDLEPYADLGKAEVGTLQELLSALIEAVSTPNGTLDDRTFISLSNALGFNFPFDLTFTDLFHARVKSIREQLEAAAQEKRGHLELDVTVDDDTNGAKVLTHVDALVNALLNWIIEPARDDRRYRARLRITRERGSSLTPRISFGITTDFTDLETAAKNLLHGPNASVEHGKLTAFGGTIGQPIAPSPIDAADGFTTTFTVTVMAGFTPRKGAANAGRLR